MIETNLFSSPLCSLTAAFVISPIAHLSPYVCKALNKTNIFVIFVITTSFIQARKKEFKILLEMEIKPHDDYKCTEKELNNFLSIFNLIEALRLICNMSLNHELDFCSIDITYRLVLFASKNNKRLMTTDEGEQAFKMSFHLQHANLYQYSRQEIILKFANLQSNNEYFEYNLARTLHLYRDLWKKTEQSKNMDILTNIKEITNLDLSSLIALNYAFTGQARKCGYITKYKKDKMKFLNAESKEIFSNDNQEKILDFCSIDYERLRTIDYDQINPLKKFPLINTKTIPNGLSSFAYVVPSQQNLSKKGTNYVYYSLADKYHANNGNAFKSAFGFVFESYVKSIFSDCLKSWTISSEIIYNKKKRLKTIDLLINKEDKLILVEIKQSSISEMSKNNCKKIDVKHDLEKTLTKGINQIFKTEDLIISQTNINLEKYNNIKHFQRLIVTYLPLEQANYIIKDWIKEDIDVNYCDRDFHIINISELEMLLEYQKNYESLFDLLQYKEIESSNIEFDEYLHKNLSNKKRPKIDVLEKIKKEFLDKLTG